VGWVYLLLSTIQYDKLPVQYSVVRVMYFICIYKYKNFILLQ